MSWRPDTVRFSRLEQGAVGLSALASTVGAIAAHPHPTANPVGDAVVALAVGTGIVVAASLARPRAWLVASGLLVVGATGPWMALAGATTALSAGALRWPKRLSCRVTGAMVGAALVQTMMRMPTDRFSGNLLLSTLVGGGLATSAWPAVGPRARRRLRAVRNTLGIGAGLACVGLGVSIVLARQALQQGVSRADAGLDAARAGEGVDAADLLGDASRAFAAAHDDLTAWWARPALLLPGVGQHARALEVLADEGAHLADAAAVSARTARVEDLQVTDGRLDLARVRGLAQPMASVRDALGRAREGTRRAESPWLIAPMANRLADFQHSIETASEEAATASAAVDVLPDLLGGSGERVYFVAFGTPAEARDLGGFMGAYAILGADRGELTLRSTGRVNNLNVFFGGRQLEDRTVFPDHYLALFPERFWQNATGSADFPTVAEAIRQMWQPPAQPLDGVLYMDPQALATMLELTGPIHLPGYSEPLTAATAAPFLLRDQYVVFPDSDVPRRGLPIDAAETRHDFLVDAAKAVFTELTSGDLPGPRVLADTLAPAVRERRLLFHSFRDDEQLLFERLDVDGALPPVDGDFLSVRASNRGRSKIDAFMQRAVTYDVAADPRHNTVHATVTVEVRNDAPASGLPDPVIGNHLDRSTGTNSTTVAIYTPLKLLDVTMNGESIGRGAQREYGRNRYSVLLDVPAESLRTVTFELTGSMDLRDGYHLDVVPQPLVNNDRFRLIIEGPSGWAWGGRATRLKELREDTSFDVPLIPDR